MGIREVIAIFWTINYPPRLHGLTPKRRAKGKFHYPTAGVFFKKLKNEDKDLFSFRNCKKWCKKSTKCNYFPFVSILHELATPWKSALYRGESKARGSMTRFGKPSSGCLWMNTTGTFAAFLLKCNAGNWWCVYKPHPGVNVRGFINPIRRLRGKGSTWQWLLKLDF